MAESSMAKWRQSNNLLFNNFNQNIMSKKALRMSSKNTKLPITQSGQHNQFQLLIDSA